MPRVFDKFAIKITDFGVRDGEFFECLKCGHKTERLLQHLVTQEEKEKGVDHYLLLLCPRCGRQLGTDD